MTDAEHTRKNVLDHGFIELVDYMGDDYRILQSARVSTGGVAQKGNDKDKKLIRYLYKNEHLTPFEQVTMTFHVKCPIFVARQWMRHRTMSFNEYSGRYSKMIDDKYVPVSIKCQSKKNHQGAEGIHENNLKRLRTIIEAYDFSQDRYDFMIDDDVAREQSRIVLPLGQYTEFYFTVNLRNLFHFLELRLDEHAQYEIRVYAQAIMKILNNMDGLKWSVEVFKEFNLLKSIFHKAINVSGSSTVELMEVLNFYIDSKE
jgi:thymidylate synthase (FAD)